MSTISQYTNRIIKKSICKVLYSNLVALGHDNVGNPEDEVEHEQDHHHQDVPQLVPNLNKCNILSRLLVLTNHVGLHKLNWSLILTRTRTVTIPNELPNFV